MPRTPEVLRYTFVDSSAGWLLIAMSDKGVVWAGFAQGDDDPKALAALTARFPKDEFEIAGDEHATWVAAVVRFAETPKKPGRKPPLDLRGTAFQREVWEALLTIPPGQTRSYGEVARQIGRPTSFRAVAQACGANPVGIVVPCHRVIGSDGSLTGYAGGLHHKRELLEAEGSLPAARR
jgi:AraC family transcriptional regulator, regulatory protein of adaptative response / methylated-DNA-[protein]-cysteine methyltransferase